MVELERQGLEVLKKWLSTIVPDRVRVLLFSDIPLRSKNFIVENALMPDL